MKLKEELTTAMHSEFTVSEETDKQLRVGSVWKLVGFDAPREEVEHWAGRYGVTYDLCIKWKSYWRNLHENSK